MRLTQPQLKTQLEATITSTDIKKLVCRKRASRVGVDLLPVPPSIYEMLQKIIKYIYKTMGKMEPGTDWNYRTLYSAEHFMLPV